MQIFHSLFLTAALVLASCAQPLLPDIPLDKPSSPSPELAKGLERCGLDLGRASLFEGKAGDRQYQYLRVGKHPVLSDPQMACLARLLVSAEIGLRTDDDAFTESYGNAWQKEHSIYERRLAKVWLAANRPSLRVPQFSGFPTDLNDFVAQMERLCNAPRDAAVVTDPTHVVLPWREGPADESDCLFTVLTASNLSEHGIKVVWGGVP